MRDARTDDTERLVQLIRHYYAHDHIEFREPLVRRGLARLLNDPSIGHAWLFEDAAEICGYALVTYGFDLEMGGRFALLTDFYLEPTHRARGLGLQNIEEIQRRLVALGVHELELTVERENVHAQALYRKAGFIARDRFPMTKRIAER